MSIHRACAIAGLLVLSACATAPASRPAPALSSAGARPATPLQPMRSTPPQAIKRPPSAATTTSPSPAVVTAPGSEPVLATQSTKTTESAAPSPASSSAKPSARHRSPPARSASHEPNSKPKRDATAKLAKAAVDGVPPASDETIRGQVTLTAIAGQQVTPADMADTLVYFMPRTASARTRSGHYTIYTNHHHFNPGAMAIPLGSTIDFVNLDSVDHNVFSVTPGSTFNLGYQSHGQTASHAFTQAGLVLISCNVHSGMKVDVLVEASPYVARVHADGHFALRGLPAGPGTLYAWNPRARLGTKALALPQSGSVQLNLMVARPRVETTLNLESRP